MPSERSNPSEMTGENAARSKVRSISLATCCRPFCTTTKVTGSIASIILSPSPLRGEDRVRGRETSCQPADGDLEVAERIHTHPVPRLDHGGGIELLDDGRPGELGPDAELLPPVHRRVAPPAVEPGAAPVRRHRPARRRGLERDEALERHRA